MIVKSFVFLVVCIASGVDASSTTRQITAIEGDDVELPCSISDGSDSAIWQNGSTILSNNQKVYAPPSNNKYFIVGERNYTFNLLLKRLSAFDEGTYSCQVPGKITHHYLLIVNVPASIRFSPEKKKITVEEEEPLELECLVSGKPRPSITWIFTGSDEERELNDYKNNTKLVIDEISRADQGFYKCTADNRVGAPASHTFRVEVEFAPIVVVKSNTVNAIPGQDATGIECHFIANPDVEVVWHRNGTDANLWSERNILTGNSKVDGYDKWTLDIRAIQPNQFGYYKCIGDNKFGRASATIVLTPLPIELKLVSAPNSRYADRYTVKWVAFSQSQLTHFMIAFKQLNETVAREWQNFSIPIVHSQIPNHTQEYTFNSLEANSSYIVSVKIKNQYGYSDWSKELIFYTASENMPESHSEIPTSAELLEPTFANESLPLRVTSSKNAIAGPERLFVIIIAAIIMLNSYQRITS